MKKIIRSSHAPEAIGPYSQAVENNGMLFVSGQIPLDADGNLTGKTIDEQTTRVLKNLLGILTDAGYSLKDVVRTTCYLSDMDLFGEMNKVYAEFFRNDPPARATVEVSRLPKNVLIEIEAIAAKQE
ncbi:MAG: RidA family protein [Bacteroidales bacterium]|jgi:2-iminobutanoate/2-iminopropanoate deaminase